MRLFISAALTAMTAMSMSAFTPIVTYQDVPQAYQKLYQKKMAGKHQKIYTEGMMTLDEAIKQARAKKAAIQKEGEQLVNFTIKLDYDKDTQYPNYLVTAFDASFDTLPDSWDFGFFDEEKGIYDMTLRPGSYNFYVVVEGDMLYLLTAEDVAIEEGMVINLSTADATNEISFQTLNPQGEQVYDNIYDENLNVIVPGNVEEMTMNSDLKIIYKDVAVDSRICNDFGIMLPDGTITTCLNLEWRVKMNDSKYFRVSRTDVFGTPEGMGYVYHYAPDAKTCNLVNDPSMYITVHDKIVKTPYEQVLDPDDEWAMIVEDSANSAFYTYGPRGIGGFSFFGLASSGTIPCDYETSLICVDPSLPYGIMPRVSLTQDVDGDIFGAPIRIHPDSSIDRLMLIGSDDSQLFMMDNDQHLISNYDETLTLTQQPAMAYGESTPFTVLKHFNSDAGMPQFDVYFSGRLGECRHIDRMDATISMKHNGNQIFSGKYANLNDLYSAWWDEPLSKGLIEIDVVNANHITPDGLRAVNTTHAEFDTNRDDMTPPAMRFFKVSDADNMPTQSFNTADDAVNGTVEITCVDTQYDTERYFITTLDTHPDVKVEYAPTGTDNFQEIEMAYMEGCDNIPGFGFHFNGKLPKVTTNAQNGWYDIRVTVSDAAGNFQRQTIGCAFQVNDMVAVEDIAADAAATVVEIYNLQGIRLNGQPEKGQTVIERLSNGTSRKVIR